MAVKKMSTFEEREKINVTEHIEKKGMFSYLSWAFAVSEIRKACPDAQWEVHEYENEKGMIQPFMNTDCGHFVKVTVTADGIPMSQVHPVLDNRNKPIEKPNSFQINTSIMRCLAKAIALHGIGLHIFAGEDLPPSTPLSKKERSEIIGLLETYGPDKSFYGQVMDSMDKNKINSENFTTMFAKLEDRLNTMKKEKT